MNPFIRDNKLRVIEFYNTRNVSSNEKTGSASYLTNKTLKLELDSVSVYHRVRSNEFWYKGTITNKGREINAYIEKNISPDKDLIKLDVATVMKNTGFGRNAILDGIKELESNDVICKESRSTFWVNPLCFYRGNIIALYRAINPENIEVVMKKNYQSVLEQIAEGFNETPQLVSIS